MENFFCHFKTVFKYAEFFLGPIQVFRLDLPRSIFFFFRSPCVDSCPATEALLIFPPKKNLLFWASHNAIFALKIYTKITIPCTRPCGAISEQAHSYSKSHILLNIAAEFSKLIVKCTKYVLMFIVITKKSILFSFHSSNNPTLRSNSQNFASWQFSILWVCRPGDHHNGFCSKVGHWYLA